MSYLHRVFTASTEAYSYRAVWGGTLWQAEGTYHWFSDRYSITMVRKHLKGCARSI